MQVDYGKNYSRNYSSRNHKPSWPHVLPPEAPTKMQLANVNWPHLPLACHGGGFGAMSPGTVTHAFTLRGAQLTHAVLIGEKRVENRHFVLKPGWLCATRLTPS